MSFVKCHLFTSETWSTAAVPAQRLRRAVCQAVSPRAGVVCVAKARGAAVPQRTPASLNRARTRLRALPRLCSLPHSEKQFMQFKWDF